MNREERRIEGFESALTARELAEVLAVSTVTIFKMAKRGTIPSFRVGSCVRFCPATIAHWLRERGGQSRGLGLLDSVAVHEPRRSDPRAVANWLRKV